MFITGITELTGISRPLVVSPTLSASSAEATSFFGGDLGIVQDKICLNHG